MKFEAKDDVDIPIEEAFDLLSDYDVFERMAMRRGIDVRRHDQDQPVGVGSSWTVNFDWRGKKIKMDAKVVKHQRPDVIQLESVMPGMDVDVVFELVALSRKRTRMSIQIESAAKTLPMRLLLQSLKLARGNIDRRLQDRVEAQCRNMEERYAQKMAVDS